jgi:hypothetical protein
MGLPKTKLDSECGTHRVFPVTIKLTENERRRITAFAESQSVARGQWMRAAVLRAMEMPIADSPVNIALNEIVGVQLLLMNVLKPLATGQSLTPAAFDKIVTEVHKMKKTVARKLTQEEK